MAPPRHRPGVRTRLARVVVGTLLVAFAGIGAGQVLSDEAGETLTRAQQAASQAIVTYERHSPDHPLWQEALAAGREAARLAPEHPAPQRFLAQAYLQIGWYARSWTAWERYLELGGPRDASVQQQRLEVATWMGINAFDEGRHEAARPFLETVLEFDPEHLAANSRLARYHLERGGPVAALPYLEAVEGREPSLEDELAEARLIVRVGSAAAGAYASALEARSAGTPGVALERALQAANHQPDFIDAWRLAGEMAVRLGRPAEAAEYFGHVLESSPTDAEAHAALAAIAFAEGDFDEAIERYSEAVRHAPDRPEYRAALSQSEAAAVQEVEQAEADALAAEEAEAAARAQAEAEAEAAAQEEARRQAAAEEAARQAAEAAEAEAAAEAAAEAERLAAEAAAAQAEEEAAARADEEAAADDPEAEAEAAAAEEAAEAEAEAEAEAAAAAAAEAEAEAEAAAAEQAAAEAAAEAEAQAAAEAEAEAEAAAAAEAAALAEEQARAEEEAAAREQAQREAAAGRAPAGADEPLVIVNATVEHQGRQDGTPGAAAFLDTPWLTTNLEDRTDDVIHVRIDVADKPDDATVSYQLCLVPAEITIRPACTDAARLTVTEPGTYEAEQPWRELLGFGGIDWAQGVDSVMLVVREAGGSDDEEASPSLLLTAQVQALSVAAGSTFPGWR